MKTNDFRVAVTGASGFVAKNLRKLLYKKGISVVAISRKKFASYKNETKIIVSDYSSSDLGSIPRCDSMIHLVGVGRQTVKNNYYKINFKITQEIVKLCKEKGIHHIVYHSGLGAHKRSPVGYFISKYKAEQEIIESGIRYSIFRPSYIIGKDDPLSKSLLKQIKSGKITIPGSGRYRMQPISARDVAHVLYQAVSTNLYSNKLLDMVGPQVVSFSEFVREFNKNRAKIVKADLEGVYHAAIHNPGSTYGIDDLNIMVGDFVGDHSKLKKISGLKFEDYKRYLQSGSLS